MVLPSVLLTVLLRTAPPPSRGPTLGLLLGHRRRLPSPHPHCQRLVTHLTPPCRWSSSQTNTPPTPPSKPTPTTGISSAAESDPASFPPSSKPFFPLPSDLLTRAAFLQRQSAVLAPVTAYMDRSTTAMQQSASKAYDHVSTTVLPKISETLNLLTGYSVVQECKQRVLEKDAQLNEARDRSDAAKRAYETMIEERRKCQRELNSLLQRKDTWLDSDITRFTELYRKDLNFEQSETHAKLEYKNAAEDFDKCHREYLNEIRERYIEEQLYSDKIRRASTWWTWGLISLHFLLFLAVQLFVEPRKRRILKEELGALITETAQNNDTLMAQALDRRLSPLMAKLDALHTLHPTPPYPLLSEHEAFTALPPAPPPPLRTPQTTSTNYPKDRLFYKGVLCGAVVGVASSLLFSFNM
ncbi:hypothetical protein PhCBS80983_g00634 [Powellomyces hirtus]|uniref:Sensitive to high expression protein 9, mitochondrial n=1 Tax=Powellomyces hirtus TaxID=109895 RepID=A0A507EE82_9FUNG|nr:hypothetical protein PhCBS80983_g00634 [Powellomyces hirtus]